MSLKRISQETFDEVIKENIEEFDMELEEAINEAINQFTKQGIDLSTIDLSGGIDREKFINILKSIDSLDVSINYNDIKKLLLELKDLLDDKYEYTKRNINILLTNNYYNIIHSLLFHYQYDELVIEVLNILKTISRSNIDIRDAFEPNGSKYISQIIKYQLDRDEDYNYIVILSCLTCIRTMNKSENNKVASMKNGLGSITINILTNEKDTNEWNMILKETCLVMRSLCIHDDIRREMSCAYDNGRFFINSSDIAKTLINYSNKFNQNASLAAAALLAARTLITTEESIKIMTQHGAMTLPKAILSYSLLFIKESSNPLDTITCVELTRSVCGLMRNLCADDERKSKLVYDGTLELLVYILNIQEFYGDWQLVEHALASLAAMSLRSPSNSIKIINFSAIDIVVKCMNKHIDRSSLLRQGCLLIRNIAARCTEYHTLLLDYGLENLLKLVGSKHIDCVDEAYGALRDLNIQVDRVKITEDGRVEAAYEHFGDTTSSNKNQLKFNPVFEESYLLSDRIESESRAPFALSKDDTNTSSNNHNHSHDHGHDHGHDLNDNHSCDCNHE